MEGPTAGHAGVQGVYWKSGKGTRWDQVGAGSRESDSLLKAMATYARGEPGNSQSVINDGRDTGAPGPGEALHTFANEKKEVFLPRSSEKQECSI
jgi:hypothetical protein